MKSVQTRVCFKGRACKDAISGGYVFNRGFEDRLLMDGRSIHFIDAQGRGAFSSRIFRSIMSDFKDATNSRGWHFLIVDLWWQLGKLNGSCSIKIVTSRFGFSFLLTSGLSCVSDACFYNVQVGLIRRKSRLLFMESDSVRASRVKVLLSGFRGVVSLEGLRIRVFYISAFKFRLLIGMSSKR